MDMEYETDVPIDEPFEETKPITEKKVESNDRNQPDAAEERMNSKLNHTEYDEIKSMGFFFNYECDETKMANLEPSSKHTILFDHISFKCNDHVGPPKPLPHSLYVDQWNENFVRMPFSDSNVDRNGRKRWLEIIRCLNLLSEVLVNDPDSIHIENAIKQNNFRYKNSWNFDIMHSFFNEILTEDQSRNILSVLIPKMIRLALDLPNKICKAIPILKQGTAHSLTFSQEQCACILANAFFCTFPSRNSQTNPENMPFINFSSIYGGSNSRRGNRKIEKLKCIFHYFSRVTDKMPEGIITFKRLSLADHEIPEFKKSKNKFRKVLIRLDGTIEDCTGATQLDFANKFLGGGVLNSGCVQEEIRFMLCPELMVSMLFTECLETNEAVLIKGCERFSSYTGYADSFKWSDNYVDETARDGWNRLHTEVLAMDAICYGNSKSQFEESKIERELKKCYASFKPNSDEITNQLTVLPNESSKKQYAALATGNWGCGAFNGDRQLKFLIQMMAAAEASRDLIYFTFNHLETVTKLTKLQWLISQSDLNVGQVHELIVSYAEHLKQLNATQFQNEDLCKFFTEKLISS